MENFGEIKRLLVLLGLNADEYVQGNSRARIYRIFARFLAVASLSFWVSANVFSLFHVNDKRFAAVAQIFNMIFAFGCELIVFLCLIRKTKQIDDLIEYKESVVNNRKCKLHQNLLIC